MAVVAPMPSASVSTATAANPGCFQNTRPTYAGFCMRPVSRGPEGAPGVTGSGACSCRSGAMYRASASPSLNSASARRVASSDDAPPLINSRHRSSRCCDSSSTISLSRVGESRSDNNRVRTSLVQRVEESGMFASGHSPHGLHERRPGLLLLCQHAFPISRQLVEAAAPLVWLFDPGTLDPSALLEAVEQGIEGIDVECELTAGPRVDQLPEIIAVARPSLEDGEDQQLRRSSLQLAVKRARVNICHGQIVFGQA